MTLARDKNRNVRCLEALGYRVRMPELIDLIDDADRRLHPDVILLESNAAFKGLFDLLLSQTRFGVALSPMRLCPKI